MGGKSRKGGGVSKKLIDKLKRSNNSCGSGSCTKKPKEDDGFGFVSPTGKKE